MENYQLLSNQTCPALIISSHSLCHNSGSMQQLVIFHRSHNTQAPTLGLATRNCTISFELPLSININSKFMRIMEDLHKSHIHCNCIWSNSDMSHWCTSAQHAKIAKFWPSPSIGVTLNTCHHTLLQILCTEPHI